MDTCHRRPGVVISGAGAVGLWLCYVLARMSIPVVLLERGERLAGMASTRNEGWLHAGPYHAAAIPDPKIAQQVARQTMDGHMQTLAFAPEAVEDRSMRSFVLLRPGEAKEVVARWRDAGVLHRPVQRTAFRRHEPCVDIANVSDVFEVPDVSIDSRKVYAKLARRATGLGALILRPAEIVGVEDDGVTVLHDGRKFLLPGFLFVHTSGFGIRDFFGKHFACQVPLRCWKSHLLDLPRICSHGVFYVAPREGTLMHHGPWSIAGMNWDSTPVEVPSYDPIPERVEELRGALRRLVTKADLLKSVPRACIKVDRDPGETESGRFYDEYRDDNGRRFSRMQLGVAFDEPVPRHFWVLPGKMTEAPYVAHRVALCLRFRLLEEEGFALPNRKDMQEAVEPRPIDSYRAPGSDGITGATLRPLDKPAGMIVVNVTATSPPLLADSAQGLEYAI